MKQATVCISIHCILCLYGVAQSGIVDLGPDKDGDRIARVKDGLVSYLPAKRVNIGAQHTGSAGHCRYIRRDRNGDLYITGPGLSNRMFRSSDGGNTWTNWAMDTQMGYISAFTILHDDSFLIAYTPSQPHWKYDTFLARSTDHGKTWTAWKVDLNLAPHKYTLQNNSDILELQDGTLLLTLDLRAGPNALQDDAGNDLPFELKGSFPYVFRSNNGGKTWTEKHLITSYAGEVHLFRMPSGKILSVIRKQRSHRMPGDPADMVEVMRKHGYYPEYTGYVEPIVEESTGWFKHMAISESTDGGRTWVNERRVSFYEECSGDLVLLADGKTMVLQYDTRYNDKFAKAGVRAKVSYDMGETWDDFEQYILGIGENYPGAIAMPNGGLITVCPYENNGPIQAVHWRP